MMPNPAENKLVQHASSELSQDERLDLALQLLKDLKPLKAQADEAGFEFLSYLLGMAELEAESIASGPSKPAASACGVCGFSNEMDSLSGFGEILYEHNC